MEASISLGERELPYLWKQSARRRTVSITLHPERGVVVHTPRRYPLREVEALLREKARWIFKHLGQMEADRAKRPQTLWQPGEEVPLRGNRYPLFCLPALEEEQVWFDGERFNLRTHELVPPPEKIETMMVDWYREEARRIINERVEHYRHGLGVSPEVIRIKDQKHRWGSCSAQGALNFSWRLILAPERVLDYVVVHELCHLRFLDHSNRFWTLVELVLPDYRELKAWLRQEGSSLTL